MSFEAEQSEDHDAVETDDEVGEPCPTSPCLGMPPVFIELNECLRLAELRQPEAMFQAGMRCAFASALSFSNQRFIWFYLFAESPTIQSRERLPLHCGQSQSGARFVDSV